MKRINKLTQKLGQWFNKDSNESASPLLLQSLEDRVLYSAVPLPVDNVEAPVETTDLDDVPPLEIESNTTLPIGEVIAEDTSSHFIAEEIYNAQYAATSADATLEDLEHLVNSIEHDDAVSTENDGPQTAMGLAEATPETSGVNFYRLQEGQSFPFTSSSLVDPGINYALGFYLVQEPSTGTLFNNGQPVAQGEFVTRLAMDSGEVIYVPEVNFVGNVDFIIENFLGTVSDDISVLYEGVADDGVAIFGDTFAPVDGSALAFEANTLDSETHIASLSDGGYVVVASLGDSSGQLKFQMFDDFGVAAGSEVAITVDEFRVSNVNVVALDDGGFLVAFEARDSSAPHLNIQRFDANGQSVNFNGSNLQLTPLGNSNTNDISIEYLGEDRFVVSYIRPGDTAIQSIVYNLDGTAEKTFVTAITGISNDNNSVETALLSDGGYVLARVQSDGNTNSIFASIFDPGSHLQQQDLQLSIDNTGNDFAIVGTTDNGFAVVWQGTSTDPTGIYAARFDRAGNAVGTPAYIAVGTTATGSSNLSSSADIVALDDGSFVVSYTTTESDGTQEVVGQRLNANLSTLGEAFTINSFSGEDQTNAEIDLLADGTLVATFKSGDSTTPATIFHQRLEMSVTGDEDTWIPLNSVIGIEPSSTTEVFETVKLSGLPVGSKVHAGQLDGSGNLIVKEVFSSNQVLIFNPTDIGQLEFMAPADASGTFEATATLTTNDGTGSESTITKFQVVVNSVIDAPSISNTTLVTDEETALTMTQAEFIENYVDSEGAAPNDLVNSIANLQFDQPNFEDRTRVLPSSTSGISAPYIFDGATALTAQLPMIGQSASFELWIRSEDFSGNDRVIAQFGDANQGFTVVQRQDEVVLQFKSASSEIFELSAEGLNGLQRSGSYDQIVVTFGTDAGDAGELDVAIFLNGDLAESITDIKTIQFDGVKQTTNTLSLGQSGIAGGVGASSADNFGGELGLLRFEHKMLDSDEVKRRYDAINNAPRIISINGQNLDSRDTVYFTTQENNIQSSLKVLPNGDIQFTPQPDFDRLTPNDIETETLNVVIQRGLETFNAVTQLEVTGVNDAPIQQFEEVTFHRDGGPVIFSLDEFVIDPDGTTANPAAPPTNIFLATPVNGVAIIGDTNGFRLEIDPLQFVGIDTIDLRVGVTDANNSQNYEYDLIVNLVDQFEISGIVADDRGLDGSIDGDQGFASVDVYLYQATNGSTDISAPSFISTVKTDASGRFVFDQFLDFEKEYFVVVDSLSVVNDPSDRNLVWAQQTFATEGAVFTGASGLELTQDAGYLIGGKDSEITDGFWDSAAITDSQHIISVSSSGNLFPLNELGFGFNFDIVNVVDNSDQANNANTELDGQGTLNQFIHNANNVDGSNRMFFVPTTAENASNASGDQWWQIEIEELLPTVSDDGTVINGRAFQTSDNGLVAISTGFDPIPDGFNGTMVGVAGDRIGESDVLLSTTTAPALEITRKAVDDSGNALPDLEYGIHVRGTVNNLDVQGVQIRNIAINGFGTDNSGDINVDRQSGNILIDGSDTANDIFNVSNFTLANNVVGTSPYFTSVPEGHNKANNVVVISAEGSEIVTDSVLGLSRYSNVIEKNVIGYADLRGIYLTSGSVDVENSDATSRWTIQSNQVSFNGLSKTDSGDGIELNRRTGDILVQENYINGNHAVGVDTFRSIGRNEILRNTIENNRPQDGGPVTEGGGIRLFGNGNTVYGNKISDNAGAGVHVTGSFLGNYSVRPSFHNTILSNEFSDNDGISIDLSRSLNPGGDRTNPNDYNAAEMQLGDGIDVNDVLLDGFTGNTGVDAPEITSAQYDGSKMTVTLNPLMSTPRPEDRVQIYLTDNNISHGEGTVFLGEVMATDLVLVDGNLQAEIYLSSDRLPFDLTQDINITATLTSFARVTINEPTGGEDFFGYQTSEFSSSQLLEVNRPPTFDTAFVTTSIVEGQTTVITLPVEDLDDDTIVYSIVSERDGAMFSVDSEGRLTFLTPPDFEAPNDSDADNRYEVLVRATDENGATAEIGVTVFVTDLNELPIFTSPATFDVTEGDLPVGQVTTTDPDADDVDYSIKPNTADGDLFVIDNAGNISFIAAPDFENPNSASGNNTYTLIVLADDGGGNLAENSITVNVKDKNDAPVIASTSPLVVNEGETAVGVITASDDDGDTVTFRLPPGIDDSDLFRITPSGTLSFVNPPDFENPLDADGNNSYEVRVIATDDKGATTQSNVLVVVSNVNELPVFTNPGTFDVTEGDLPVGLITTTDPDADTVTYSIKPGTRDGDLFVIDSNNNINFALPPDFENPNSVSGNNTYTLTVLADDGNGVLSEKLITVQVINLNEAPEIASTPIFMVNEGETAVGVITASDEDGDTVTFSLPPGIDDSDLFQITPSGTLSFNTAPDFENSNAVDGNNSYGVRVIATDANGATTEHDLRVNVVDVNEAPEFSGTSEFDIPEGDTVVGQITATDPDNDSIVYSIKPGTRDGSLFNIDNAGNINFNLPPDFENPNSVSGNNTYTLTVVADDQNGLSVETLVTVDVNQRNELPVIGPTTGFTVVEGETEIAVVSTSDDDGDTVLLSVQPGTEDGDLFSVSPAGMLSFITAPDFESPTSVSGGNSYVLSLIADDQNGGVVTRLINVDVLNGNDAPVISAMPTISVDEGVGFVQTVSATDVDGDAVTFSILNAGDSSQFSIDAAGNISFNSTPDFESPTDTNGNNLYEIAVSANDGNGGTSTLTIGVKVNDVNEAPVFVGKASQLFLEQDESSIATYNLAGLFTDPENDDVTLQIAGGSDASLFHIVNNELALIQAPELNGPLSPIYQVQVVANDGFSNSSIETVSLKINNINDAPKSNETSIIVSQNEGDANASFGIDPQDRFDADGDSTNLRIVGDGADNDLFEIVNDRIKFKVPPILTNGAQQTYTVTTALNDGTVNSEIVSFEITVENVNNRPEITTITPVSDLELDQFDSGVGVNLVDVVTSDFDGDVVNLRLADGGPDNDLFEVVNNRLQFKETPEIGGGETATYNVNIVAHDGQLNSAAESISISVKNINDQPEITDIDAAPLLNLSQIEAGGFVTDLSAAGTYDKDDDPVSIALGGAGQDNALFEIVNNKLQFKATPQLAGVAQKEFDVSVVASDGRLNSTPQAISITVENDNGVSNLDQIPQSQGNDLQDSEQTDTPESFEEISEESGNVDTFSTPPRIQQQETISQQPTPRRNDINGITAVSDLKTGDDDSFFDLSSESVSYLYQFDAQGPQLVTQEIGDIIENRIGVDDMKLEKSLLANYFWQGFEDSEDEFIRKNLQVDNSTIVATSAGLSLGLVSYLRLVAMATTVVTQLPAWKALDVAPLINAFDEEEAETIHQIVDA